MIGSGRTARAFALLSVCLNLKVILVLNAVAIITRSSFHLHVLLKYNAYNGNDGYVFIFVECMKCCPGWLDEQKVRLCCSVCLHLKVILVFNVKAKYL